MFGWIRCSRSNQNPNCSTLHVLSKGPYMNEVPCTPSEFELIEKKFQLSVFALANPTLVGKEKA